MVHMLIWCLYHRKTALWNTVLKSYYIGSKKNMNIIFIKQSSLHIFKIFKEKKMTCEKSLYLKAF